MKKLIVSLILILAFNVFVFGDDLDTFKEEQEMLNRRMVERQQIINYMRTRLIELNALIRYIELKQEKKAE